MSNNKKQQTINRSSLQDINKVHIDTTLPREDRIKSFIDQIGDPYCYLDGDVVVSIGYADTPITLQDRLISYVSSLR